MDTLRLPENAAIQPCPSRILICRPNVRVGNNLLLTPLLAELESCFPGAQTDIVTASDAAMDIFCGFDSVGEIIRLPRHGAAHLLAYARAFLGAHGHVYDMIIDPCLQSGSSRFWTRMMSARQKIGFCSATSPRKSLTVSIPDSQAPAHMGHYPVWMLRKVLGKAIGDYPPVSIRLTAAEREFGQRKMQQLLSAPRPGLKVVVFADATGRKKLPASWWETMIAAMKVRQGGINLLEIVTASNRSMLQIPAKFYSSNIRRVASVIGAADLFISADGGVMHLGVASGAPTIGLFNVTDQAVYGPYGRGNCSIGVNGRTPEQVANSILDHIRAIGDVEPLA